MTFDEFYVREYLERHADARCRRLHLLGLLASLVFLGGVVWLRLWGLLIVAPLPAYLLSWLGHVLAGNRPTAYVHPWWSFRGYWRMILETATDRLTARERLQDPADIPDGSPSAPAVPSRQPG